MVNARQWGKTAALAQSYGGSLKEFVVQGQAMNRLWRAYASSMENGPFTMLLHGGSKTRNKKRYKVVNKHGNRVHRGTHGSCVHKMEKLNFEYAKWLMTEE